MGIKLIFRGPELLSGHSIYSVARASGVSYPTAHAYLTRPQTLDYVRSDTVAKLLDGLGYSDKDIENMKVSDLFAVEVED